MMDGYHDVILSGGAAGARDRTSAESLREVDENVSAVCSENVPLNHINSTR
jgi:hypothetical protein